MEGASAALLELVGTCDRSSIRRLQSALGARATGHELSCTSVFQDALPQAR
jgi:hypothetical protein